VGGGHGLEPHTIARERGAFSMESDHGRLDKRV
jgi:hypothetical protein